MEHRDYGEDPVIDDLLGISTDIYSQGVNRVRALYQDDGNNTMSQGINRVQITQPKLKNGNVVVRASSDMRRPMEDIEYIMNESIKSLRFQLEERNDALFWYSVRRELMDHETFKVQFDARKMDCIRPTHYGKE